MIEFEEKKAVRLTEYSHGAGCGCKISPAMLKQILGHGESGMDFPNLLVGNAESDDAAVYDLDGETAIVSTTDFFMPIVDDPFDFGAIAATNAISDIYAMGGTPIMAIAILGWPIDKLAPEIAGQVIEGGKRVCAQAGIALAGGHSIDSPEPIFGLAVTGRVPVSKVKRNGGAKAGDMIYLTKPLGIGMVTTAQKKGIARLEDLDMAKKSMMTLNDVGAQVTDLPYVNAITDVTGFGLAGHLIEMCQGSGLGAQLEYEKIPTFPFVDHYLDLKCHPGGTNRNWASYGSKVDIVDDEDRFILADPQTSGGLLMAVNSDHAADFEKTMSEKGFDLKSFGVFTAKQGVKVLKG